MIYFFLSLLFSSCFLLSFVQSQLQPVDFKRLDPNNTDPSEFWYSLINPVPEDYVKNPRYPIVPSPGPIQMDTLEKLYPNGTAKPTNIWYKNLWGFAFDDYTNWSGIYSYPYIVEPRIGNINFMYPGKPVGFSQNSRMLYGLVEPPKNATPTIHNASYPYLTMGAAYDFGALILNSDNLQLDYAGDLSVRLAYKVSSTGNTVGVLSLVKGSPYVNIECTDAQIGFGSLLTPVGGKPPPIISINDTPAGGSVTGKSFKFYVAVGPSHPSGAFWHAYFDKEVTLDYPDPTLPIKMEGSYTGLLQIACGEKQDQLKGLLDANAGVYASSGEVKYQLDKTNNQGAIVFEYDKVSPPGDTRDLMMLALPHHILGGLKTNSNKSSIAVPYWTVKGEMEAVFGDKWTMEYNLTTAGFGEGQTMDPKMSPIVKEQAEFEFERYMMKCPGDNVTGQGIPGYKNMELYAYVRDLARYTDVSTILYNLGETEKAINLTQHVLECSKYILTKVDSAPTPCEPPINNSATCVRDQMQVYYDTLWGGLVTGWYDRFAVHYCQGCNNPTGYNPFSNYGNAFYNDHHFQYGYLIKNLAWPLYLKNVKGEDIGLNDTQAEQLGKQALAFARDIANPDELDDTFFPSVRHKDFFDGHSWAEGYDYSGRILTWVNQQSGGEAVNSFYGVYLLGLALQDDNVMNFGRIHLASEMQSLSVYQHLSNRTEYLKELPTPEINSVVKCLSILIGNGASGATYYGPNSQFECGITVLPVTPITKEFIDPVWAGEAYDWLQFHVEKGGLCVYPDPSKMSQNPCGGQYGPDWWGNEYSCCPTNVGYPQNQWRAYPDWFPYTYLLLSFNDTQAGWEKLQVESLYKPTADLPFPYLNSFDTVTGYQHDLSRAVTLFTIATHPN